MQSEVVLTPFSRKRRRKYMYLLHNIKYTFGVRFSNWLRKVVKNVLKHQICSLVHKYRQVQLNFPGRGLALFPRLTLCAEPYITCITSILLSLFVCFFALLYEVLFVLTTCFGILIYIAMRRIK